jgi:hypothetical protein
MSSSKRRIEKALGDPGEPEQNTRQEPEEDR